MEHDSDEAIMTEIMAGNAEALALLVERYHAPLLGYLYRLMHGDRALAEDLVQETFLHLLRQRGYRAQRPFKPWLYAIATNLARDHFKSAATRHVVRWDEETEGDPSDSADVCDPEALTLVAEQGEIVRTMLAHLSEEYRVVVLLRFYQGLKLQEIAAVLHIPLGTVKSRLSGATRQLQKYFTSAGERIV